MNIRRQIRLQTVLLDCGMLGKWIGGNIHFCFGNKPTVTLAPPAEQIISFVPAMSRPKVTIINCEVGSKTGFLVYKLDRHIMFEAEFFTKQLLLAGFQKIN